VPVKDSKYLKAGAPTRCQNRACNKQFDRYCIRGSDQYYCCEVCAQVGLEIDFEKVANGEVASIRAADNSRSMSEAGRPMP
jgi:hypothetical protein